MSEAISSVELRAKKQLLLIKLFNMLPSSISLSEIHRRIDEVNRFLSITLSIANAHTVEFYTHDVWSRFMAVEPQEVLRAVSSYRDQQRAPEHKIKGNYKYRQNNVCTLITLSCINEEDRSLNMRHIVMLNTLMLFILSNLHFPPCCFKKRI